MQGNASSDENDPVDAGNLAKGVGFLVRVPWRQNLKIRDIQERIKDDELRDELMDVFDARQMFLEKTKKLKRDITALKAENIRVAEFEATQRTVRFSLGFSAQNFTHRVGSR